MLKENVVKALNGQLNAELYSAYLYLSMGAYLATIKLPGFINWMRQQAKEEYAHAMRFFEYVSDSGARVTLTQIDGPPTEWESPLDVFEHVYRHEQKVTGLINGLVELAVSEGDDTTKDFLQWFVGEQVEEEESASSVLEKVKQAGNDSGKLSALDAELAKRGL